MCVAFPPGKVWSHNSLLGPFLSVLISLSLLIFNVAEEMLFLRLGEEVLKVSAFSFLSLFMAFIKVFSIYPLSEDQFAQNLVIYSIDPFPVCACIELGDS